MTAIEKFNVPGAPEPTAHVAIVEPGYRMVHIGGQTPIDANGKQMVGDFEGQVDLVFANVTGVLESIDATWEDVAFVRGYLTRSTDFPLYVAARERFYSKVCDKPPATTSLIVTGLYHPDCLFEMDVLAVAPAK
jgi:enamine deaminase RidA (YjgF/YER057c/UK114 family)